MSKKAISFSDLSEGWRDDPSFGEAYRQVAPMVDLAFALADARHRAKLSQAEVARRMGTTQSAVARLESARTLPSTATLARFAKATGSRLRPTMPRYLRRATSAQLQPRPRIDAT